MKIPKSFKLFGTTIKVEWDNMRLNDKGKYGESAYSLAKISLADTIGLEPLSEDVILDTFYHEKVHMILNSMNKDDLSSDEEFVDVFAKLLRQSDSTAVYENNDE